MLEESVALGDCIEVMAQLPDACVDAIITDPPYGLEFMGKEWDRFKIGRAAKYSKGGEITHADFKDLGGLPQYVSRPAKRCAKCGKQAWSGSPCKCESPEWVIDNSPLEAYQSWTTAWATEAYRILKPGAYMLVMGGTRTHHRLGSGLEDAGFEIRDELAWIYASGFPKNYDVSKGIDKKAGAEREVVGRKRLNLRDKEAYIPKAEPQWAGEFKEPSRGNLITQPTTPEAQYWEGYGTALKPAHEPIWLCKKPNEGTYVDNVLKHGCGAMNIDGCRVEYRGQEDKEAATQLIHHKIPTGAHGVYGLFSPEKPRSTQGGQSGRWPANLIVDSHPEEFIGGVVIEGEGALAWTKSKAGDPTKEGFLKGMGHGPDYVGLEGSKGNGLLGPYTRFFVIPKPSKKEKTCGGKVENKHVTVKPVGLGKWLIKLITPHQHPVVVVDPFCGSGTFLVSALELNREGYQIEMWGIDKDEDSVKTAKARVKITKDQAIQGTLL